MEQSVFESVFKLTIWKACMWAGVFFVWGMFFDGATKLVCFLSCKTGLCVTILQNVSLFPNISYLNSASGFCKQWRLRLWDEIKNAKNGVQVTMAFYVKVWVTYELLCHLFSLKCVSLFLLHSATGECPTWHFVLKIPNMEAFVN